MICLLVSILPKKSVYISNLLRPRVDELVETILNLKAQLKGKEKELTEHLKGLPKDTEIGEEYGAFYDYTLSSRPSYKALFEDVLNSLCAAPHVLRWWTRKVVRKANEWLASEKEEHPSANKSLVYFTLDKKEKELSRRA